MKTSKYSVLLIMGISLLLGLVATTNYIVDPANIYASADDSSANAYVTRLIKSEHGLLWPNDSWSEREIKQQLAATVSKNDTAVIGSSRVMQASSLCKTPSFREISRSVINLGVSGATLEDYIVLAGALSQGPNRPDAIIFGIDPWALDWKQDSRWTRYDDAYVAMRRRLDDKSNITDIENASNRFGTLQNLINFEYFNRSLAVIGEASHSIQEAPPLNIEAGMEHPVLQPDGSLVYSAEYIQKSISPDNAFAPGDYKIKESGTIISPSAVREFTRLALHLKEQNIQIHFALIPYHHNVWENRESRITQVLAEVESFVLELGKTLDIPVWGSYNPEFLDCNRDEFFDYMHPTRSALAKLKRRK